MKMKRILYLSLIIGISLPHMAHTDSPFLDGRYQKINTASMSEMYARMNGDWKDSSTLSSNEQHFGSNIKQESFHHDVNPASADSFKAGNNSSAFRSKISSNKAKLSFLVFGLGSAAYGYQKMNKLDSKFSQMSDDLSVSINDAVSVSINDDVSISMSNISMPMDDVEKNSTNLSAEKKYDSSFAQLSALCTENRVKTAGALALITALGYGGYRLYKYLNAKDK